MVEIDVNLSSSLLSSFCRHEKRKSRRRGRRRRKVKRERRERTIHGEYVIERVALKRRSTLRAHKYVQAYNHSFSKALGRSQNRNWQLLKHTSTEEKRIVFSYKFRCHWSSWSDDDDVVVISMIIIVSRQLKGLLGMWGRRRMWNIVMRDRLPSSPINLFISSTKMASTTTSTNVNGKWKECQVTRFDRNASFWTFVEILPGLESFLRSMVNSSHLNTDHRQIATMYIDKIDQLSKFVDPDSPNSPQGYPTTPIIDDQSL